MPNSSGYYKSLNACFKQKTKERIAKLEKEMQSAQLAISAQNPTPIFMKRQVNSIVQMGEDLAETPVQDFQLPDYLKDKIITKALYLAEQVENTYANKQTQGGK